LTGSPSSNCGLGIKQTVWIKRRENLKKRKKIADQIKNHFPQRETNLDSLGEIQESLPLDHMGISVAIALAVPCVKLGYNQGRFSAMYLTCIADRVDKHLLTCRASKW